MRHPASAHSTRCRASAGTDGLITLAPCPRHSQTHWPDSAPRPPSRCWPAPARSRPRAARCCTSRSASRASTPRRTSWTLPRRRCATATRATARRRACPSCARRSPPTSRVRGGITVEPGPRRGRARRQAIPALLGARDLQPRRRGRVSRPGLPDLRVGDPLRRRRAGAAAAGRGARVRVRRLGSRRPARPADAARDPELAGEPDGRRHRSRAERASSPRCCGRTTATCSPTRSTPRSCTRASTTRSRAYEGLEERVILLESASKTFSMTGWRLGYAALPAVLVEPMVRLAINTYSCVAPATQLAGVAALTGPMDSVRAMVASLEERRDLLVSGLNELPGVRCAMPKGAFYAFPNVSDTGIDANVLADRLLRRPVSRCSRAARSDSMDGGTCASPRRRRARRSRARSRRSRRCSSRSFRRAMSLSAFSGLSPQRPERNRHGSARTLHPQAVRNASPAGRTVGEVAGSGYAAPRIAWIPSRQAASRSAPGGNRSLSSRIVMPWANAQAARARSGFSPAAR